MQIDYKTLLIQKIHKNSLYLSVIILFHDNCPLGSNYSQTYFQIHTFYDNWANSRMLIGWELWLIRVKTKEILVHNQSLPSVSDWQYFPSYF